MRWSGRMNEWTNNWFSESKIKKKATSWRSWIAIELDLYSKAFEIEFRFEVDFSKVLPFCEVIIIYNHLCVINEVDSSVVSALVIFDLSPCLSKVRVQERYSWLSVCLFTRQASCLLNSLLCSRCLFLSQRTPSPYRFLSVLDTLTLTFESRGRKEVRIVAVARVL